MFRRGLYHADDPAMIAVGTRAWDVLDERVAEVIDDPVERGAACVAA